MAFLKKILEDTVQTENHKRERQHIKDADDPTKEKSQENLQDEAWEPTAQSVVEGQNTDRLHVSREGEVEPDHAGPCRSWKEPGLYSVSDATERF